MIFMFPYFLPNGKLSQVGPLRGKFCQPNCICSQICIFSHVSTACLHMECNKIERERMVKLRSGVTMARWKGPETWSGSKHTRLRSVTGSALPRGSAKAGSSRFPANEMFWPETTSPCGRMHQLEVVLQVWPQSPAAHKHAVTHKQPQRSSSQRRGSLAFLRHVNNPKCTNLPKL